MPANLDRTDGSALGNVLKGHFRSGEKKKYMLFVDTAKPPFVYLDYGFRHNHPERPNIPTKTQKLYQDLKNFIK